MKKALPFQKSLYSFFSLFFFYLGLSKFIRVGGQGQPISFRKGMKPSVAFEWRSPVFFFQISFLLLFLAGFLMLLPRNDEGGEIPRQLQTMGWIKRESSPCQPDHEGFYLAEGNLSSKEFYFSGAGEIFASNELPWPDTPVTCVSLDKPMQIEEI